MGMPFQTWYWFCTIKLPQWPATILRDQRKSVGEDVEDFVQQIINNRVWIYSYGEYDVIYNGEKPITLKDNNGSRTVNTSLEPFDPQGRQLNLKFIDGFTERTSFIMSMSSTCAYTILLWMFQKPKWMHPRANENMLYPNVREEHISSYQATQAVWDKNVFKLCAWKLMKKSKSINLNPRHNKTAFLLFAWIIYFYRFLIWVTVVKVFTLKRSCLILSSSSSISGGSSS